MEFSYVSIPIKKFISGEQTPVDLHLKIGDEKYLKVINKGDRYDKNRLLNYENHKATQLYLTNADFSIYLNYCFDLVERLFGSKTTTDAHDIYTICRIGELIYAELLAKGFNAETSKLIERYGTSVDNMIRGGPMMGRLSVELMNIDEKLVQHGLSVGIVTMLLVQGMKWRSDANIKFLFLCSLILDVGLLMNPNLVDKTTAEMTEVEKDIYLSHPALGAEVILKSGVRHADKIAQIILHHHELPDGTGFPNQYNMQEIHPMALPVIMSDRIVHLLFDKESPLKEKNFASAFKYLYIRERQFYPTIYWEGLTHWQKIFQ